MRGSLDYLHNLIQEAENEEEDCDNVVFEDVIYLHNYIYVCVSVTF